MQTTAAEPAAIYVDASCGDDRADGATPATAIASLERLESFTLKPGTRVLFRAGGIWYGSYHPVGGGLPQQPVSITRYGAGPDPILCGTTESSTVYIRNMSHLVLERLEVTHSCRKTDRPLRGVYLCYGGEGGEYRDICLRDLYIHDIGGCAQREAGGLVIWADTAERPVTFSRLTVAGCTICDQAAQGITFSSVYSYRTGIDWTDKPYAPSRDIHICDNYIARCGGDGIFQSCADDPVLERNTVTGCCFAGNTAYAGIWPHNSQRPVMRGNESFGNRLVGGDGQGYDVDINCTDSVVERNYSHHNEGGSILLCTSGDIGGYNNGILVRDNLCEEDLGQIFTLSGPLRQVRLIGNRVTVRQQPHTRLIGFYQWGQSGGGPEQVEIVGNDFTLDSDGHDQVCWDTHPIVRDNRFAGSYDYGDLWMTGQDRSQ